MAKKAPTKAPKAAAADNKAGKKRKTTRTVKSEKVKETLARNAIKPGQVLNPAGRPKGSRNKFGEAFIADFLADWEENGAQVLRTARIEEPAAYLRVAASILPKELNINEGETALERLLDKYSNDELDQLIAGLGALGASTQSSEDKNKEAARKQSDQFH